MTSPRGDVRESPRTRRFSRTSALVLATAAVLLFAFAFRGTLLRAPAAFLDVGESATSADLIYLLNGSIDTRPFAAAELYHQGVANRIVVSRVADDAATRMGVLPNETDASVELMAKQGVPDSAIAVLRSGSGVASTGDEAALLREYVVQNPAERVMVVTNTYHTRRARWLLRRHLRGLPVEVRMYAVADPDFDAESWWRVEEGMLAYLEEYLKFVHNWIYRRPVPTG